MKSYDGVSKPSGVILITFELYNLPSKIEISWHSVKVREYIPNPMRCKSCQLLGHTTKKCVNTPVCSECALSPHSPSKCTKICCANCSGEHSASSRQCPKYQEQREILKIKTVRKCTMREAKTIFKTTSQNSVNTASYSSVAKTSHQRSENANQNKNDKIKIASTVEAPKKTPSPSPSHSPIPQSPIHTTPYQPKPSTSLAHNKYNLSPASHCILTRNPC